MTMLRVGSLSCTCRVVEHEPRLIVLTGGPGAGKTAVLEAAALCFCEHVAILPEAASIVFGGGFPRHGSDPGRRSAQRAIYHVQRELERLVVEERRVAVGLCDRGTIDGAAYWPAGAQRYWSDIGTDRLSELGRYEAVVHLEPASGSGYERTDLRVEGAHEAREIDQRIQEAWRDHPDFVSVGRRTDFFAKQMTVLELVRGLLPECCYGHPLRSGNGSQGMPGGAR